MASPRIVKSVLDIFRGFGRVAVDTTEKDIDVKLVVNFAYSTGIVVQAVSNAAGAIAADTTCKTL